MLAVSIATTDLLPFTFSSRNLFDFLLGASLWSRITFGVDILISPENCIRIKFTFFDVSMLRENKLSSWFLVTQKFQENLQAMQRAMEWMAFILFSFYRCG